MAGRFLILNADDLGYDPAVTRGILKAMREGIVSSTTFMVNTPFSEESGAQARGMPVGLHLNLARHPPLWRAFPPALLVAGAFAEERAAELPAQVVEAETLAQLDRLEALTGQRATHVDVHKHLHRHPQVLEGLIAAARRRALPVRALDSAMRAALRSAGLRTTDHFIGDAGAEAYWTLEQLGASLEALAEGCTELMCHPGFTPEAVRSGYAAQREVELRTFLAPAARALLAQHGVRVGTFAEL